MQRQSHIFLIPVEIVSYSCAHMKGNFWYNLFSGGIGVCIHEGIYLIVIMNIYNMTWLPYMDKCVIY